MSSFGDSLRNARGGEFIEPLCVAALNTPTESCR